MLYKVIIEAISKTMEQQTKSRLDEDFFYQAVDVIHFFKKQGVLEKYRDMLQDFISRVNQESMFYIAPMFVKMYLTERLDSPNAKKIQLMLEAMSAKQRQQAYEETVKLLENKSEKQLPAFHLEKLQEIFGIMQKESPL